MYYSLWVYWVCLGKRRFRSLSPAASSTHVRPFVNDIRIQTCDIDVGGGSCEGYDDIDDAVEGMETDEECYLESWMVTKCYDAHVTVADRWNAERKGGRPRDSSRLH